MRRIVRIMQGQSLQHNRLSLSIWLKNDPVTLVELTINVRRVVLQCPSNVASVNCEQPDTLKDTELKHSDVEGLITRNPQLKKICLLNCPYLTHETLLHIVEKCVHLKELRFYNIEAARYYDKSVNTDLVVKFIELHRPKLKVVFAELIF